MEKAKFRENNQANGPAKFFRKRIFNLKNFNRILFALAVILGVFYLASANDLAIKGFTLSDLKERRAKIANENKKLELKAMDLSSYNTINEKVAGLKMVAVCNIDYLNESAAVAKK